jgi:hypothetical protein
LYHENFQEVAQSLLNEKDSSEEETNLATETVQQTPSGKPKQQKIEVRNI